MAGRICVYLCFIMVCKGIKTRSVTLQQVLILSRHNIRTPLLEDLDMYSSKSWPKWNESAGHLTKKGALLEGYMGQYIAEWLEDKDLIKGCPTNDEVLIYANTQPRTIASAKAFTESAFRFCNITVHHQNKTVFDPLFFPMFHNKTEYFRNVISEEMENKLKESNLTESYLELARILNLKNSAVCKKLFLCDLRLHANDIVNLNDEEPNVSGPLFIGNAIVDSFIMSYYEGMPIEDVAWGEIKTDDQWRLLTKISRENQNVRFNLTTGAKDLAEPLLKYMFSIFEKGTPKFTLLMGHDSNLNPVVRSLNFKLFHLPQQFEPFPIGGKLVFQKWILNATEYLKVEYIYPSSTQLRYGYRLSLIEPPQRVILELNECKVSTNGFCLWSNFMKLNVFT